MYRTGLSKVGMPGADVGLQAEDVTIAELLKPLGYATGQFGKNHLGDLNKFLPTVHGFDEFFGNLYHLNAEEEPEHAELAAGRGLPPLQRALPARAASCTRWATDEDDDTEEGRFGRVGRQRIEDTGPLTKKRMETIDDEVLEHAVDFIDRQAAADTPFFCWFNTTHMHFRTHPKPESVGQAGRWQSPYHDTMIDHDKVVGALLDKLDELGLAEDTIVVYSTDNGPHMNTWPDAGMTPFRSEKNTNWEGAFRVPEMIRWPGRIPAGRRCRTRSSSTTTGCRRSSPPPASPTSSRSSRPATTIGDTTFKVHIDGYNLLPYLTGEVDESPRKGIVYFSDDGDVLALRFDNWKVVFMEQRVHGHAADLGRAVRVAARAQALQPAHRPVRARRRHVEHVLRLVLDDAYLVLAATHASSREFLADLRGVPAAPEGRELHDRPGGGEARERADLGPTDASAVLERRAGADGDPRVRRARERRRAARTTCRPPSASPCSTTTARCGARSRPTCRRCSSSRAWARRPRRDPSWPSSPVVKALLAGDLAGAQQYGMEAIAGVLLELDAGRTTEEFTPRRRGLARRGEASALRRAVPGADATRRCSS